MSVKLEPLGFHTPTIVTVGIYDTFMHPIREILHTNSSIMNVKLKSISCELELACKDFGKKISDVNGYRQPWELWVNSELWGHITFIEYPYTFA